MKNIKFFYPQLFSLILFLLPACSTSESSKDENKNSQDSLKQSVSISPGTANVKALILDSSKGETASYKIRIDEVTEYGAGTPILPVGSEVQLFANDTDENRKKLKTGENIFIHIAYTKGMGENKGYWTLINHLN